jgi:hypothetical protein
MYRKVRNQFCWWWLNLYSTKHLRALLVHHARDILAHVTSFSGNIPPTEVTQRLVNIECCLLVMPPSPPFGGTTWGWNAVAGYPCAGGGGIGGIGGRICDPCRHTNTQIEYLIVRACRTLSSSIANQFSNILPNDSKKKELRWTLILLGFRVWNIGFEISGLKYRVWNILCLIQREPPYRPKLHYFILFCLVHHLPREWNFACGFLKSLPVLYFSFLFLQLAPHWLKCRHYCSNIILIAESCIVAEA